MTPKVILLFSGKRKSGKDYLTEHLFKVLQKESKMKKVKMASCFTKSGSKSSRTSSMQKDGIIFHLLGEKCEVIKISQPIKSHWAKERNLDLNDLLSDGPYKERYRKDMIIWSEEMRDKDYGCFCRAACQNAMDKPVWIVSDVRRKTDVQWFKENYGDLIKMIRITADEETRKERGFFFEHGVDDVISECGLDDYSDWDLVIDNGKGRQSLQEQIDSILKLLPL